jgi:hypothetical protein
MTTNVPQDVIDLVVEHAENGNWPEFDAAIELLRAQRQQGAEPVAVKALCEKLMMSAQKDLFTRDQIANLLGGWSAVEAGFMSTPPQANALVAAAYRKAAEIAKKYTEGGVGSMRDVVMITTADSIREEILAAIPADPEAALRERDLKIAEAFYAIGLGDDDFPSLSMWDEDAAKQIINSVLGEGGK